MRRKPAERICVAMLTGLLSVLFATSYLSGSPADKIRLSEAYVQKILRSPAKRTRRFSPRGISPYQIVIKVNDTKLQLNPEDVDRYEQLTRNEVKTLTYVTHLCQNDIPGVNALVDKQRIARLYELKPSLFSAKNVRWNRLYQTGCLYDYQATNWFHGFILTLKYVPADGTGNFLAARF